MRNTCWMLASMFALGLAARAQAPDPTSPEAAKRIQALIRALDNTDPAARRAAVESLGDCGQAAGSAATPLAALLADKDPGVARAAVTALGRIGPAAVGASDDVAALLKHPEPLMRREAARTLGRLTTGAAESLHDLWTPFLRSDGYDLASTQQAVAPIETAAHRIDEALTRLGGLFADPDATAVAIAVEATANILAGWHASRIVLEIQVAEATAKARRDDPSFKRADAARIALTTSADGRVAPLTALIGKAPRDTQAFAISGLGYLGSAATPAIDALTKLLDSDDARLNRRAVWALGEIGSSIVPVGNSLSDRQLTKVQSDVITALDLFAKDKGHDSAVRALASSTANRVRTVARSR